MSPATYEPLLELLFRHGVSPKHAQRLARVELYAWELSEIDTFFKKVDVPSPNYPLFRSIQVAPTSLPLELADRSIFQKWWPSLWDKSPRWASASHTMMAAAVTEHSALCINVKGEWMLRKADYVALSHVWIEGLNRDDEHGGVEMTKVEKIFELIRKAGLKEEWVWTDVLAIPSHPNAIPSTEDELLITDLINTMPQVYSQASAVFVLDALVLQLQSNDFKDVALALACGKWARRMWTYQEIKLAKKALVATSLGAVDFHEMIDWLQEMKAIDELRDRRLWLWAAIMGKTDKHRLTIRDLMEACLTRSAGLDVDYARALFPLLGLQWEAGMTREQGMQKIYHSMKADTAEIAPMAGSRRMKIEPAWAPSIWQGLEGSGSDELQWETRGVRGPWYVLKVKRLIETTLPRFGKVGIRLEVESETDRTLQIITAPNEDPDVVEAVKKLADSGRCLLLANNTFRERLTQRAQSVLVAEEAKTEAEDGLEVAVYCSAVMGVPGVRQDERITLLIRHGNPTIDDDLLNKLRYYIFVRNRPGASKEQEK